MISRQRSVVTVLGVKLERLDFGISPFLRQIFTVRLLAPAIGCDGVRERK